MYPALAQHAPSQARSAPRAVAVAVAPRARPARPARARPEDDSGRQSAMPRSARRFSALAVSATSLDEIPRTCAGTRRALHGHMKKTTTTKLALRSDTLRVLTNLSTIHGGQWTTRNSKGLPCTNEPTTTNTCPTFTCPPETK